MLMRSLLAMSLLAATAALAQDYPAKPVRVLVPWAAGGSTDSIGRIVAAKLTENLGHQFVVDNRPGATGTIGHGQAAKAPADGYTVLLGSNSTFAIAPYMYKSLPYDNDTAFAPITLAATSPQILSIHPSVPAKDLKGFIALARAKPDAIVFSTAGTGATSHMATELLMAMTGIRMVHVPYKGGSPSAQALLGGETAMSFVDVITALPFAQAGRLRPLGTSGGKRSPMMPDVPTISEAGLAGFESSTTFGVFVPAGTPRLVVDKLAREWTRALTAPDVREKLRVQGIDVVAGSPDEFASYIKAESAKWAKVIRERGIKIE
jgi:tripartite-type tricarboxylate transporter receptor subunit TctC